MHQRGSIDAPGALGTDEVGEKNFHATRMGREKLADVQYAHVRKARRDEWSPAEDQVGGYGRTGDCSAFQTTRRNSGNLPITHAVTTASANTSTEITGTVHHALPLDSERPSVSRVKSMYRTWTQ